MRLPGRVAGQRDERRALGGLQARQETGGVIRRCCAGLGRRHLRSGGSMKPSDRYHGQSQKRATESPHAVPPISRLFSHYSSSDITRTPSKRNDMRLEVSRNCAPPRAAKPCEVIRPAAVRSEARGDGLLALEGGLALLHERAPALDV